MSACNLRDNQEKKTVSSCSSISLGTRLQFRGLQLFALTTSLCENTVALVAEVSSRGHDQTLRLFTAWPSTMKPQACKQRGHAVPRRILSECESDHRRQQLFVTTPLHPVTQSEATYALKEWTEPLWSHQEVWSCLPAFSSLHSGRCDNLSFSSGGWPEPRHALSHTSGFSTVSRKLPPFCQAATC